MRIVCVGGGPGGLYFAIAAKSRNPEYEITVFERDLPELTYGWGVTYTDELLDRMNRHDPVSAKRVRDHSVLWQGMRTCLYGGRESFGRGYGYAIARTSLLQILADRASELGAQIRYGCPIEDLSSCPEGDLVVAADGANSRIRQCLPEQFGTQRQSGRNQYLWLGTEQVFGDLRFALEKTPAGLVWLHGYPFEPGMSTCVVECSPQTCRELGLDSANAGRTAQLLSEVFAEVLDGRPLLDRAGGAPSRSQHFEHVRNSRWYHGNVVLLGDAAHTTHFSLGAGTSEAITDATTLARSLHEHADLPAALASYEQRRRRAMKRLQKEARASMAEYERIDAYAHLDAVAFAAVLAGENPTLASARLRDRWGQIRLVRGVRRRQDSAAQRHYAGRRGWLVGP